MWSLKQLLGSTKQFVAFADSTNTGKRSSRNEDQVQNPGQPVGYRAGGGRLVGRPNPASMTEASELTHLRAENARLVVLLEAHGIEWRAPQPTKLPMNESSTLSTAEKVALFRRLFRGRTDVYPVRWEGQNSGRSGYTPACADEWRRGFCEKPRIKVTKDSSKSESFD